MGAGCRSGQARRRPRRALRLSSRVGFLVRLGLVGDRQGHCRLHSFNFQAARRCPACRGSRASESHTDAGDLESLALASIRLSLSESGSRQRSWSGWTVTTSDDPTTSARDYVQAESGPPRADKKTLISPGLVFLDCSASSVSRSESSRDCDDPDAPS